MNQTPHSRAGLLPAVLTTLLILLITASAAGQGGPTAALHPLTADGQIVLSPSDRCPVCAMFPARRPEAAAALTLESGETVYFCSNGCLLRSWLRPGVYLGRNRQTIDRVVVQDYFSGQCVDGRSATWVAGSDVMGPMGPAIVTLGNTDHLTVFQKRHGSQQVFTLNDVDDALWQTISHRQLPATTD